jgi:hypothetical protein
LKGDEITFSTTREVNGNKMTSKYSGKISGDTIKGKMEFERNGEPVSRDWEAKRGYSIAAVLGGQGLKGTYISFKSSINVRNLRRIEGW